MKKILFSGFIFLFLFSGSAFARDVPFDKTLLQGDRAETIDGIMTIYGNDPAVIIPLKAQAKDNNLLKIEFKRKTASARLDVVFEFVQNGKVFQSRRKLWIAGHQDFKEAVFNLQTTRGYTGLIKFVGVLFEADDEAVSIKKISIEPITWSNLVYARFIEVFDYYPFQPPTINYLMGPTWNGEWINKPVVIFVTSVFGVLILLYLLIRRELWKKRWIKMGFFIVVFFWLGLDVVHTVNQVRIYKNMVFVDDVMQNARSAPEFLKFLEFIRQNVPKGKTAAFIATYPNNPEGPYHIYPHLKFAPLDQAAYIVVYNKSTAFDYKFAEFDAQAMELKHGDRVFKIKTVIPYNDQMAVYEVLR